MSTPPTPSTNNSGLTMRAFLRALVRVLILLVVLAVIVAGVYLGAPLVYRELVLPVRDTSARLDALEENLAADRAALMERLSDLQTRLNQLEAARISTGSDQAGLQGDIDALRRDLDEFSGSLAQLDAIEGEINALNEWLSYTSTQVMGMQNPAQDPAADLNALRHEVAQLKALNLLTRAQVHLAQNNFGLAREDTALARAVLVDLRNTATESELFLVDAWIARLDLALSNLPSFPVLAAGDLEQAYQLMAVASLSGESPAVPVGTITVTLAFWLTETSDALTGTPTPLPTFTPMPLRSSTATAIPNLTPTPTPRP